MLLCSFQNSIISRKWKQLFEIQSSLNFQKYLPKGHITVSTAHKYVYIWECVIFRVIIYNSTSQSLLNHIYYISAPTKSMCYHMYTRAHTHVQPCRDLQKHKSVGYQVTAYFLGSVTAIKYKQIKSFILIILQG